MDDYKIVIIYGNENIPEGYKEGDIHYYGKVTDDLFHNVYLLNYAKEFLPNADIFKNLNPRHPKEIVAFFLNQLGHIVFFNITDYNEKSLSKYGKLGMFMIPETITDSQKEALLEFSKTIPDFDCFLKYDVKIVDGMIDSKSYQSSDRMIPEELVEAYFKIKDINHKKI